MSIPQSEEQVKASEGDERQEEMDAIVTFGTRRGFPSVAGACVQRTLLGAGRDEATAEAKELNPSQ